MEFKIIFWHWLILGMILMMCEIFIPSFTIFWFGLGAIATGICLWIMPNISLTFQIFLWTITSCVFTYLWFKHFKPLMKDRTYAGISREAILGQRGLVIKAPVEKSRGVLRFTVPVLGSDEWEFICNTEIKIGESVEVTDVSGNTLIVKKHK